MAVLGDGFDRLERFVWSGTDSGTRGENNGVAPAIGVEGCSKRDAPSPPSSLVADGRGEDLSCSLGDKAPKSGVDWC